MGARYVDREVLDESIKSELDDKLSASEGVDWTLLKNIPRLANDAWQAPVATPAHLPLEGNKDGDLRETFDPRQLYTWDESLGQWLLLGSASDQVDWYEIVNKPDVFPPAPHNHTWVQILDKPSAFPPTYHTHDWDDITNKPNIPDVDFPNADLLRKLTETEEHSSYDMSKIPDLDARVTAIESGYSDGHFHGNLEALEKVRYTGSQETVDLKQIEINTSNIAGKVSQLDFDGHVQNASVHVTQAKKDAWSRSATVVVAASNSSEKAKNGADFIASSGNAQETINQAFTTLPSDGGKVLLMEGTYDISGQIEIPNNTTLEGMGRGTVLRMIDNAGDVDVIVCQNRNGIVIKNMRLDGNKANNPTSDGAHAGIDFVNVQQSVIENVEIVDFSTYGIYVSAASKRNRIQNCNVANSGDGILFVNDSDNNIISSNVVWGGASGICVTGSSGNIVSDNVTYSNNEGIYTSNESNTTIHGNVIHNNVTGIRLDGSYNNVQNNTVRNNIQFGIHVTGTGNNIANNDLYDAGAFANLLDEGTDTVSSGNRGVSSGGGGSTLWMNDWSAYETIYDWSGLNTITVPSNSWGTILEMSGEGYLTFCRAFASVGVASNPDIKITIDGQETLFEGVQGHQYHGNVLLQPLYFRNSIKIEIRNRRTTDATVGCDYTVLKKISEPTESVQTYLHSGTRKMAYISSNATTYSDLLNITGSGYLVGVLIEGYYTYNTSAGLIRSSIIVDGQEVMTDRHLLSPGSTAYKQSLFIGPIRFDSSLRIQCRTTSMGTSWLGKAWYTLD